MRDSAAVIGPEMEAMLAAGQQVQLVVSGDSMRPTLKPRRDAAVLEPVRDWPPKRGDILLFGSERSASGYALHRVVRVGQGGPYMNGDGQNWVEGPLARENVLAIAVAIVRNGRIIDAKARGYRLLVRCWGVTRRVRWPLFAAWRAVKRLVGKK